MRPRYNAKGPGGTCHCKICGFRSSRRGVLMHVRQAHSLCRTCGNPIPDGADIHCIDCRNKEAQSCG